MKLVGLAFLLVLLLTSCTKPATTQTPSGTATAAPSFSPAPSTPTGPYGELKVAQSTLGEELFYPPRGSFTNATTILAPMYDWLLTLKGMELAPGIVERWEIAADGLSWTYFVRKGVKFHNGDALTARDVKFTLEGYTSPAAVSSLLRSMINRVDMVDDYTVRVVTKGVQPYLARMSTTHDPSLGEVVPKDYIDKNGLDYFQAHPVGSGPFKFVRRVAGDFVEYEAVNGHWRQTPAFKKLTIVLMPEESTRVAALKTGTVDAIDSGLDEARTLENAGFSAPALDFMLPLVQLYGAYDPRAAGTPVADAKVRQALSLAINRDEIRRTFFYGKADPAFVANLAPGAADVDTAYWSSYAANIYRYDPEQAKQLLKDAGYGNGFTIKLYTFSMSGAPYLPKLGEVVAGYWAKVGVNAQITPIDFGVYTAWRVIIGKGAPPPELVGTAAMFRHTNNPVAPKPLTAIFSGSTPTHALLGKAFPDLDKLLDSAAAEPDPNKRKDALAKAIKIGTDTWVALPISSAPVTAALGPAVTIDFPKPAISLAFYLDLARHKK